MSSIPNLLERIDFGNEAGDDVQASEIVNFFVEQSSFHKFLDPTKRILLSTAKKGVGKSALIRWIEAKVREKNPKDVLVISCKAIWFVLTLSSHLN
jgi:predicted Ser/Thr protein kinase